MDRGSDYYSVPSSSLEPPHSSGSGVDDETPSDRGSGTSQAWQNAIQRYLLELQKGGIRYQPIDRDLYKIKSPSELLNEIKSLQQPPSNSESIISLNKVVSSLNDFAAVVAFALGMNGRVAALLWGAFRILFNLSQPVFPEIVKMLEELETALPRFKQYEEQLPRRKDLEDALCTVYSDIIVFCGHAITFLRNNPNFAKSTLVWSRFNKECLTTIHAIRVHSRRVDEEVEISRITRGGQNTEAIKAISELNLSPASHMGGKTCYVVPHGINPQFLHRTKELDQIKQILDPSGTDKQDQLRVLAIHGLGGVGKTQLALHYANSSRSTFPAIAWISSGTRIKMHEAINVLAQELGLASQGDQQGDIQTILKVKDCFNSCKQSFLLVFDNVEDIDLVLPIWPSNLNASILITTRSLSIASKRSQNVLQLNPLASDQSIEALYKFVGQPPDTEPESGAAKEICHLLAGLPLAIIQISQFIRERGYGYEEFLGLYKKSAARIHSRGDAPPGYDYTLDTVWDISISKLSSNARILQTLLAFFDPDSIPERFLRNDKVVLAHESFEFLSDELDFGDAVGDLLKLSLLSRSSATKTLSIHRLVQTAVLSRLSKSERDLMFDSAINFVSLGFPNTWGNEGKPQQGHGYESWETCGAALPHTQRLMEIYKEQKIGSIDEEQFAVLSFRGGQYLWEREQPTTALIFFHFGLSLNIDKGNPLYNYALRMLGHIALDMARPRIALKSYEECLEMRLKCYDENSREIANVYDSIACSYTEVGNTDRALEYLDKAKTIHLANDASQMSRTDAIYAMTYLRAGQPDEALKALKHCWDLQGLDEDTIALSRYPKHSGDMVLLSRIYDAQGKAQAALQLASRSITVRKGILGAKGPRVADSTYIVACMHRQQGSVALAAKLLREIISMSEDITEMKGHLARALWALSDLGEHIEDSEAGTLKQRAREVRDTIEGRECDDVDADKSFSQLVGWMLW